MSQTHFQVGIDLGGTKIEAVILSPLGEIIDRKRVPTQAHKGYSSILVNVQDLFESITQALPHECKITIGMGIPGIISPSTNLVINSNTQAIMGKPLRADLEQKLKQTIKIENDANCFTLAESISGSGKGYQFVFGIIMGTGCGGGLCINQKVRRGLHAITGEWGHASIDPNGPLCYSGFNGCIESFISGSGVQKQHLLRTSDSISMETIIERWRNNDDDCSITMNHFFENFGRAVAVLINILDPDAIILGGGLSNIPELYTTGLQSIKKNVFFESPKTPILKNKLGDSAGVIGAAWIGLDTSSMQ